MVFCGKPSKACHACRARKTRCDQDPKGCGQCARVGRDCPGYRKQIDLLFRDRTEDVIRKSQALETSTNRSINKTRRGTTRKKPDVADAILVYSLQPGVEDCAICYFVANYVSALQSPLMGSFSALNDVYRRPDVESALTTSVRAVSLASYGCFTRNERLKRAAHIDYIKAIKEVNLAIRSTSKATMDSTLLSVLFLVQYEMQTGNKETALASWAAHVQGAASLLKLRGDQQLESSGGRLLFAEVLKCLLTCCLQQRMRLPSQVHDLVRSLRYYEESVGAGLHILENMIALNELRVDIREFQLERGMAIDRLSSLDESLSQFYKQHPCPWQFENHEFEGLPAYDFIFQKQYSVYTNVYVASAWNALRATRIYIHDEICRLLESDLPNPDQDDAKIYQQSLHISTSMKADILASVPQHLGYIELTDSDTEPKRDLTGYGKDAGHSHVLTAHKLRKYPISDASHYYVLIWPIWFVGYDKRSPDDVRQFCISILERIGHEVGIQHAMVFANVIRTSHRPRPWFGER